MKKLFKLAVVGLAVAGLAAPATAAVNTYTVNMCGASAQAGFWQQAGASVVKSALNCTDAVLDCDADEKKLIVKGTGCAVDDSTQDDTVYVRYTASSSSTGCKKYDCENEDYADPTTCDFTDDVTGECSSTFVQAPCMLGCADVACDTITATTEGYYTGRKGAASGEAWEAFGNANGYAPTQPYSDTYNGVTVPFGFIVNNSVKDHYCDYASVDADAHFAYDKRGWECDPDETWDDDDDPATAEVAGAASCRGDYKCLDTNEDGTGVCLDGNQNADLDVTITGSETSCSDASDCKMAITGVTCEEKPLKGISRLMALHIFADKVTTWRDFGPSFAVLPIVKCMRHGGSGTHQTLINTVFRGDAEVASTTVHTPGRYTPGAYVWHYKSSSDLTRDCVAYYAGGIGYVDADKVMFRSKIGNTQSSEGANSTRYGVKDSDGNYIWQGDGSAFTSEDGIHQLMYQGVAPSRNDVANGKYNFWAAQQCFTDTTLSCQDDDTASILNLIMTEAGKPAYLDFANFGQRAYHWATQDEMMVEKTDEYAYPTRK